MLAATTAVMPANQTRSRLRRAVVPVLIPVAFAVLTACGGNDRGVDAQMQADLQAASQAAPMRGQYMSPMEMGYGAGYAPAPGDRKSVV